MTGYLDKVIRPLVLKMHKRNWYVKTFKVKDGNKDKDNKSFYLDEDKLLEKYKAIWTKTEDLKNIDWNSLTVYDDRYTYRDKDYTSFCGSKLLEDDIEWESFTVISIDSLLVYENKNYLQVYIDNCAYKRRNKQMTEFFMIIFLKIRY